MLRYFWPLGRTLAERAQQAHTQSVRSRIMQGTLWRHHLLGAVCTQLCTLTIAHARAAQHIAIFLLQYLQLAYINRWKLSVCLSAYIDKIQYHFGVFFIFQKRRKLQAYTIIHEMDVVH